MAESKSGASSFDRAWILTFGGPQSSITDFLKKHQGTGGRHQVPRFSEAVELYEKDLKANTHMKPRSKEYRLGCIQKLQRTWPALWEQRLNEVGAQDCKDWAAKLSKEVASQYFNNMIGTLRLIIDRGIKEHKEHTGEKLENPAEELRRNKVKQKDHRAWINVISTTSGTF